MKPKTNMITLTLGAIVFIAIGLCLETFYFDFLHFNIQPLWHKPLYETGKLSLVLHQAFVIITYAISSAAMLQLIFRNNWLIKACFVLWTGFILFYACCLGLGQLIDSELIARSLPRFIKNKLLMNPAIFLFGLILGEIRRKTLK